MKTESECTFKARIAQNKVALLGLAFAVLTILFGQTLGIVFGLNEGAIKSQLKSSSTEVLDSIYKGDEAAAKTVLDKSWSYLQRAHLHAGGMGTTAVVLILMLTLIGAKEIVNGAISIALGAGGFGYSLFWMWAGFRAPGLGSTGLAKESLKWLAMPSSGVFVVATLAAFLVIVRRIITKQPATN